MASAKNYDIVCRLKQIRMKKGLTQTRLAEYAGIKRQAVYDMEAGKYLPNTAVAIALADMLDCRVEDIFIPARQTGRDQKIHFVQATGSTGSRIAVAKVRGKLYGYPASGRHALNEQMIPADGLVEKKQGRVRLFRSDTQLDMTALLLGCDPAFSLIGNHLLQSKGNAQLKCRFASSKTALELVARGKAHVAGTHFHDTGETSSNIAIAQKNIGPTGGLVIAFSSFEEGLMVKAGNPLHIKNPADLAREDVMLANREKGAALRTLLDDALKKQGIPADHVRGYDNIVFSHVEGANHILYQHSDAALGLKIVAESFGLDFIPMAEVRCDLVIPADLEDHPAVKAMLDTLQTRALQKEIESLPGYDAVQTGNLIAEF